MKFGTLTMRKVENFKVGERVAFDNERFDYEIESIETTAIGMIRHRHGNGTASSSYWPGEILYTRESQP